MYYINYYYVFMYYNDCNEKAQGEKKNTKPSMVKGLGSPGCGGAGEVRTNCRTK